MKKHSAPLALLLLSVAFSSTAFARSYCCNDASGRLFCGDGLPDACKGRAYREVNDKGVTVKTIDAPLPPEQKQQKEAALAKQKEEEAKKAEEERKNRVLLGTYSSIKDIETARDRVLLDLNKSLTQAKQKLAEAEKRKQQLAAEAEFYKKSTPPDNLKSQLRENEADLKGQQKNVDARNQDIEAARAKFEEDKQRFISLTTGKTSSK